MLKSMTGYGRAGFKIGTAEFSLEISAVNQRGLQISVFGPQEWTTLERFVAGVIREKIFRGKVQLNFSVKNAAEQNALAWDNDAAAETLRKLERQAILTGVPFAPDAHLLLRIADIHRVRCEGLPSLENDTAAQKIVLDAVKMALAQLVKMREDEGVFLKNDLMARLSRLENSLDEISARSRETVTRYRAALFARLEQAGLTLDSDDERVAKEIALFADRSDICEEITRLRSHFEQFKNCLSETQEVGRKLDFICQEINREFNTIGSKANFIEITRHVIDAKNELERVREQVQNVE